MATANKTTSTEKQSTAQNKKAALQRDDNTFILRDAFYPTVEKHLKNTSQVNAFLRYVAEYRNKNIDILSSIYPTRFLIFERTGEDSNIVFRTCGVNRNDIMPKVKEARKAVLLDQIKSDENVELCTMLIMMMKYFYNDKEKLRACYMYYAYSVWHLVYKKYYNKYAPSADVVQYTIDELNNKFDVKKLGSLDAAIEKFMSAFADWAEDKLERLSDKDIIDIMQSVRTRLNAMNKNIGNKIHANAKAGNRTFVSTETNDDTGELIADRESNLGSASVLASQYTTKFFTAGASAKLCHTAAGMCGVSESELRTAVSLIIAERNVREVKTFYECLFYAFFSYYPQSTVADVKTTKFIAAANSIYKKGNSLDKNINTIKDLSHVWLEKGSRTYKVSNHAATKNSFRKAIYMYFVLSCATNTD
jgi:predicted RNA-binding protein Jag